MEYLENSNRYYDLTTEAYIKYFGENFHLFLWPKHLSRAQAIMHTNNMFIVDGKLSSSSKVIDLGCGIGSLAILIGKRYGCEVCAININRHQLNIAKNHSKRRYPNITFLYNDIMQLNLNKMFDTAFFIDVEPHLPDKRKALSNIRKALSSGGRIIMTAWLQNEKPSMLQKEFLIKPFCRLGAFPYLETFSGYNKLFKRENLRVIKCQDVTNKARRSVDEFYHFAFQILSGLKSFRNFLNLAKNSPVLKTLRRGEIRNQMHNAFLGPIYAKLCMDAGVFKLGYFVLEKV
ncbi:MAG: methyltransferase domain-containing protein [Nanoarchaeota archaeon]|mgnify:CR=1 FL=1